MLNTIPACISPDLMKIMMEMGHADELVLADANFPADTFGSRVVRADGVKINTLLRAILPFYPLDTYVDNPVMAMGPVGDDVLPPVMNEFIEIISSHCSAVTEFKYLERFEFYERAQRAYAIVITGELDGNIILKKGVVSNII